MIEYSIWPALGLFVIASLIPRHNKIKLPLTGISWMFFSIHWMLQWEHYYELEDYVTVLLTISAAVFSIYIGYLMIKKDRLLFRNVNGIDTLTSISMMTTAAAIGGISYFLFAEIHSLNLWIISIVTDQTVWLGSFLGIMITRLDWNLISVNGYKV